MLVGKGLARARARARVEVMVRSNACIESVCVPRYAKVHRSKRGERKRREERKKKIPLGGLSETPGGTKTGHFTGFSARRPPRPALIALKTSNLLVNHMDMLNLHYQYSLVKT